MDTPGFASPAAAAGLEGVRALLLVENLSVPADPRVWPEALALREAGLDVTVVCPRGTTRDREAHEVVDGVEIHRYRPRPAQRAAGYAVEYATAAVNMALLAGRLAAKRRFDIVHGSNAPDLLLPAVSFLKLRGSRFVFDQHDLAPELYQTRFERGQDAGYWLLRALERVSFALADVVISPNESYRSVAITRGGRYLLDVFVVRNAPDEKRVYRVPAEPSLAAGKPHLISYLGAIAPQDGVDHALHALAQLRDRRDDWHAIFMGDGPAVPSLRELATELQLDGRIEFSGWADGDYLRAVLSTSAVCLAPEPSGPLNDASTLIKIAEYMSIGAPVVCYDLPESRATAREAALYASRNDPGSLADQIAALLDAPDLRARLGDEGRRRVREQLSWARSKPVLLDAYRRALAMDEPVAGSTPTC